MLNHLAANCDEMIKRAKHCEADRDKYIFKEIYVSTKLVLDLLPDAMDAVRSQKSLDKK